MKVIGIIGGVGTGKSEITKYMAQNFNACIIIADEIGHQVLYKDSPAYEAIIQHFGKDILDSNNDIDRKALGNIVFKDKKSLDWLNKTTHPLIYKIVTDKINEAKNSQMFDIIIFEAAIMVEAHWLNLVDYVWLVTCSEDVRIERLTKTRNMSKEKIKNIINKQHKDSYLKDFADVVIDNTNDKEQTFQKVYMETLKILEAQK